MARLMASPVVGWEVCQGVVHRRTPYVRKPHLEDWQQ
jgi:hypothetical protein